MKKKRLKGLQHQHKYKSETVWRMTLVMLITGATLTFLVLSILQIYMTPAKTYYFAANYDDNDFKPNWKLASFSNSNLDKPLMSDGEVLQWATDSLLKSFKLNYNSPWVCTGYDKSNSIMSPSPASQRRDTSTSVSQMSSKFKNIMTRGPMEYFNKFIRQHQLPTGSTYQTILCSKTAGKRDGILSAKIAAAPSITQQNTSFSKKYYWVMTIPISISRYQAFSKVQIKPTHQDYWARVLVTREDQSKYPYVVAIEKLFISDKRIEN